MFTTRQGELGDALGLGPKLPIRNCINYSRAVVLSSKKRSTPLMDSFVRTERAFYLAQWLFIKKGSN